MHHVEVGLAPLERLAAILPPDRAQQLADNAARARAGFADRVIWHVNATAQGGGVAEMLQTLLDGAFSRDEMTRSETWNSTAARRGRRDKCLSCRLQSSAFTLRAVISRCRL